jgi:hypothetical protein
MAEDLLTLRYFQIKEPLKRKALAKLSNAEQASMASRYFGATKHVSELGASKLLLTRSFLAKSTVSNPVFCAIDTELIAKLSTLQDSRYKFFRNEKTTTISMNAERPNDPRVLHPQKLFCD